MVDPTQFNTVKNDELAQKVLNSGNHSASVMTYVPGSEDKPDGFIYAGQITADGYIDKSERLVNLDKLVQHNKLVAAGNPGLEQNAVFTQKYLTILENAKAQMNKIESNPGIPIPQLLGAAATGSNLIETDYEVVRRVNYLSGVVSKQYNLPDFIAQKMFNERRVSVLNAVGFRKSSALLEGQKEIGDHVVPAVAKQAFASYEKSLYADSFRYEFGMREKKDSVVNLVGQITAEIPGLMAKMKHDKAITLLNALTDTGALGDWDAITAGNFVYDDDAAADVEADEAAFNQYQGPIHLIAPRAVIRGYLRNTRQVGIGSNQANPESLDPAAQRTGRMTLNPQVQYFVSEDITAGTYAITKPLGYGDHLRGPVVNVSYKNQLTPAQTEGRITFDFNGFVEKDTSAARRHTSVLS